MCVLSNKIQQLLEYSESQNLVTKVVLVTLSLTIFHSVYVYPLEFNNILDISPDPSEASLVEA